MHSRLSIWVAAAGMVATLASSNAYAANETTRYTIQDTIAPSELRIGIALPNDTGESGWKKVLPVSNDMLAYFLNRENRSSNIEVLTQPLAEQFDIHQLPTPLPNDFLHHPQGASLLLRFYQHSYQEVVGLQKITINGKKALRFRLQQFPTPDQPLVQVQELVTFIHKNRIVTLQFTTIGLVEARATKRIAGPNKKQNVASTYSYDTIIESIRLEYRKK